MNHQHKPEPCPTPSKSRRRRNTLWACPQCGHVWVLRYSTQVAPVVPVTAPHRSIAGTWNAPVWDWFPSGLVSGA